MYDASWDARNATAAAISPGLDSFIQGFLASARNGYFRAFLLKALCRRQTDAAVSAGNDRHFSVQSVHHFCQSGLPILTNPHDFDKVENVSGYLDNRSLSPVTFFYVDQ